MEELLLDIKVANHYKDFNDFEEQLVESVRELLLERVRQYLEHVDKETSDRFEALHPEYSYHGLLRCKLRCYYGSVWICIRRHRCKGKPDVYPPEEFLPEGGMSKMLEELAIELSTEVSYQRSSRLLERFIGLKVSGKGIWHYVQRRGREERERVNAEQSRIFEEGRDEYPQDLIPNKACFRLGQRVV